MGAAEMYPELYAEHMTGNPAYDKAFAALADCPSFAQVEQALKTYAHELAEKIRAEVGFADAISTHTARWAAALIDPMKEGDRG